MMACKSKTMLALLAVFLVTGFDSAQATSMLHKVAAHLRHKHKHHLANSFANDHHHGISSKLSLRRNVSGGGGGGSGGGGGNGTEEVFVPLNSAGEVPAEAGGTEIEVPSDVAFSFEGGDNIVIAAGTATEEYNVIKGYSPEEVVNPASLLQGGKRRSSGLQLLHPLQYAHPAGFTIGTIPPTDPHFEFYVPTTTPAPIVINSGPAISQRNSDNILMVTNTLKDILSSVRAEESEDKAAHKTYIDLCDEKITTTQGAIDVSRPALQAAQTVLSTAAAEVEGLSRTVKQNQNDATELMDAMTQAQNLRYTQQDQYNQDMTLNTQSITQITKAIQTLQKVQQAGGFLQNGHIQRLQLNEPGESGYVLGVMKGILMKLKKTKKKLEDQETARVTAYDSLMTTNQATLQNLQTSIMTDKGTLTQKKIDQNAAVRTVKTEGKNLERLEAALSKVKEDKFSTEKAYDMVAADRVKEKSAINEAIRYLMLELGEHAYVEVTTASTEAVQAGEKAMSLPDEAIQNMHSGDNVVISAGTAQEEYNVIIGLATAFVQGKNMRRTGTVQFLHPFQFVHPPGATIGTISPDDPHFEAVNVDREIQKIEEAAEAARAAELAANGTSSSSSSSSSSAGNSSFLDVDDVGTPDDAADETEEDSNDDSDSAPMFMQIDAPSFGQAVPSSVQAAPSFVQVSAKNDLQGDEADQEAVSEQQTLRQHEKDDEFKALINMIKQLLNTHKTTQKTETDKKKFCEDSLEAAAKKKEETEDLIEKLGAAITQKSAKVTEYTNDLATCETFLTDEKADVDHAKRVRAAEKTHYEAQSKDRNLAIRVLDQAKKVLTDFYDMKTGASGKKRKAIQSNAAISLLAQISGDITKQQTDATREEEEKAVIFENARKDYRDNYDKKMREIIELKQNKGKLSVQINSHQEKKTAAETELGSINGQITTLEADCNELIANYDDRKNARRFEINQLLDIQDIIAGSSLAVRTQ